MWTGFYAGLNAGGTWANSNEQTIAVTPGAEEGVWATRNIAARQGYLSNFSRAASASGFGNNSSGFIGGGQIGYNFEASNGLVAGLEADSQGIASAGSQHTSSRSLIVGVYGPSFCYLGNCGYRTDEGHLGINSLRNNLEYLGTVRGRVGVTVVPSLLVYGTGGLAYGGVSLSTATLVLTTGTGPWARAQLPAFGSVNFSNTQVGWTAGGGLEWMFMPNWSAKVEYLYYNLGTVTQNFVLAARDPRPPPGTAFFGGQARAPVNGNIVRAGVNYHFNWSAVPVVAKY